MHSHMVECCSHENCVREGRGDPRKLLLTENVKCIKVAAKFPGLPFSWLILAVVFGQVR